MGWFKLPKAKGTCAHLMSSSLERRPYWSTNTPTSWKQIKYSGEHRPPAIETSKIATGKLLVFLARDMR